MNTQVPWDTVLNILFFAIGFVIGLAQLWQAQRFYLADQRNKFEQISGAVTQIAQRLAVIEGVTNRLVEIDRTLSNIGVTSTSLHDRLFGIVERQFLVGEQTGQATVEASDEIRGLIKQELTNSEFVTPAQMAQLQEKLDRVLNELSNQILTLAQQTSGPLRENLPTVQRKVDNAIISGNDSVMTSGETGTLYDGDLLQFGKLRLDMRLKLAWLGERELHLTPNSFALLKLFVENPFRVFLIEEIIQCVYGPNAENISSNNVFMLIHRLRSAIRSDASIIIRSVNTVSGRGYMLVDDQAPTA